MKSRMYIVATLIGLMMICTLFTAKAAEYRKEVKPDNPTVDFKTTQTTVLDYSFNVYTVDAYSIQLVNNIVFLLPVNDYFLQNAVTYIKPINDGKPDNRRINGLINDNFSKHRIYLDPTS